MNWFSHWDEDLEDGIASLEDVKTVPFASKNPYDYKIPSDEEINDATSDISNYKGHPSISTNEYKKAPRLDLVLNSLKDLSVPYENTTECAICKVETPKRDNLIRCPHCSESYYMENYSDCTAMYFPPIYKDGVNINPDRNTTTTHCTCMNCGKNFSYKW